MSSVSLYDAAYCRATDRPDVRERIVREGVGSLSDAELIAALIGTGTRGKKVTELSEEILGLIDSTTCLPSAEALGSLSGVGEAKACALYAALELGRRLYGPRDHRITSPKDVWSIVSHWSDRKQERFICCSLNGAHELIAARIVSIGLVNRTVVHPREVFADPITDRACAVIVAHNHPSGRLDPSPEDREITSRLKEASDTLGIALLDHLIFSKDGYYSFVEHGLLDPNPAE